MTEPSREEVEALLAKIEKFEGSRMFGEFYSDISKTLRALLTLAYDKDTGEKYIERAAISEELRKDRNDGISELRMNMIRDFEAMAFELQDTQARLSEVTAELEYACETAKQRRDEAYLQRMRADKAEARLSELEKALEVAQTAINDWCVQYAPSECGGEAIEETHTRIALNGGTLSYMAGVSAIIRAALHPKGQ